MFVDMEVRGGSVGIITMNRPATNSLNILLLSELSQAIDAFEEQKEIHVVLIKSSLSFGFSSGLDLGSFYKAGDREKTGWNIYNSVKQVFDINQKIVKSAKIYIAVLSGPVIGSAVSIALSCDLRIANETMWLWLPDPQYGGLLADGGSEMLAHLIGSSRAKMALLTNDRISAKKAWDWGLIYDMPDGPNLELISLNISRRLASYSYATLRETKKAFNDGVFGTFRRDELMNTAFSFEMYQRLEQYCHNGIKGRNNDVASK
ncbi:enoyl-CoA hydratase/isomerase family protein [Paenibacillus sp. M1]|uniref:Enoyl-CoA hydratase/isomerase family protein n=1 Tax=Paenibacillus haidiansis TaxID=1574488 RepID=A0ABU7VQ73_9BACL